MVEQADTVALKATAARRAGSSPAPGTDDDRHRCLSSVRCASLEQLGQHLAIADSTTPELAFRSGMPDRLMFAANAVFDMWPEHPEETFGDIGCFLPGVPDLSSPSRI